MPHLFVSGKDEGIAWLHGDLHLLRVGGAVIDVVGDRELLSDVAISR